MNLSALFINRPIATALLMVGLLLLGLVAYPLLPVASLPSVNYPTISVTSQLPGADPQTTAATVTSPLELQFGEIPGVAQMTSSSTLGESVINVQFNLSTSINAAAADVLAAINAANGQLPPNLTYPPTIRKVNPADTPILVLAVTSDAVPLTTVDAYAENILMQKISQIAGVGLVGIGGQQKPAIRVAGQPAGARGPRHQPRRRAQRARQCQCRPAERHAEQPERDLYAQYQRSASEALRLRQPDRRLPERGAGAGARHRPGGLGTRERPASRLV